MIDSADQETNPGSDLELIQESLRFTDLIGLVPSNAQELSSIADQESELVRDALGDEAGFVDPTRLEEDIVVISARKNLQRTVDEQARSVYVVYQGASNPKHQNGEVIELKPYGDKTDPSGGIRQYGIGYSPKPTQAWAFTPEDLEAAVQLEERLEALQRQYAEAHPLGEGAVLLANKYGGVNPLDFEGTERSLMARFLAADDLQLEDDVDNYVKHGLLEPITARVVGDRVLWLKKQVNPSLQVFRQLSQVEGADSEQAITMLEQLVRGKYEEFLQAVGQRLIFAAQALRDPGMADSVISSLGSAVPSFHNILQTGTAEKHRKR